MGTPEGMGYIAVLIPFMGSLLLFGLELLLEKMGFEKLPIIFRVFGWLCAVPAILVGVLMFMMQI